MKGVEETPPAKIPLRSIHTRPLPHRGDLRRARVETGLGVTGRRYTRRHPLQRHAFQGPLSSGHRAPQERVRCVLHFIRDCVVRLLREQRSGEESGDRGESEEGEQNAEEHALERKQRARCAGCGEHYRRIVHGVTGVWRVREE
jgi:hypothetical protein